MHDLFVAPNRFYENMWKTCQTISMYRCLAFMLRVQRMCSACCSSERWFWIGCGCKHHYIRILIRSHILIVASSWRDVRRAWQQPPRGPWLKMGWQLSGVWWTIMDHVTSSWTVIFACHFHHNYNGTTSRDSNVEYLRRRVRAWKKPWHVPTHDGLSMLPRHLLIPPDLSPWHLWSAAMQIPNL